MKRKILSESTGNYRNGGRLRHLPGLNCAVVAWNRWNLCFFALRLHLRYPGSQVLEAYANANTSSRKWKTFHSLRWRLRLHLRQGGWKCKSLYLHCKACVCTYICVARLKQAFAFSSKSHTCLNEAKYSFVRFWDYWQYLTLYNCVHLQYIEVCKCTRTIRVC